MSEKAQYWEGRFQILSLDGGGIKGLFAAAVLAKLEEKLETDIVSHFDLITGTSTGGVIALGLGLGMTAREIVGFYVKEGPKIFGNRLGWRSWLQWVRPKYPQDRLRLALEGPNAFGDRKLGDSKKRLVIPAYNLGQDRVRMFKTPHHERLTTDWQIPAWQVAMATSAAPTYFCACRYIKDMRLIDGGMWANNPAVVGIAEAVGMLGAGLDDIRVLSIGTTDSRKERSLFLDHGGVAQWVVGNDVVEVLMRAQSVGTDGLAGYLIGQEDLLRVDPIVPDGIYHLDKASFNGLMSEAEDCALCNGPKVRERFGDHAARTYVPFHPKPLEKPT
jgi:patatin-like phospholipase/acyl hydrolase